MRTRTNTEPAEAVVSLIQQESGCRIHIERSCRQIRIFGPKHKVIVAQQQLDELEGMCKMEYVEITNNVSTETEVLEPFANKFGISLCAQKLSNNQSVLAVYGIARAVAEATNELRKCNCDVRASSAGPSESARMAILEAFYQLKAAG